MVRRERTIKKTGQSSTESRYYLSSAMPQEYTPLEWLELIRGHWGGVEIRNHWRRDALMGGDGSRSRNARLLANLALIGNALLQVMPDRLEEQSLPQLHESLTAIGSNTAGAATVHAGFLQLPPLLIESAAHTPSFNEVGDPSAINCVKQTTSIGPPGIFCRLVKLTRPFRIIEKSARKTDLRWL